MHSLRRALRLPAPSTYPAAAAASSCLRAFSSHRRAPPPPPRSAATGDDEWNDAWETAWLPGDSPASSPAPAAPWESPTSASAPAVPAVSAEVDPDTKAFVADMDERWAERRAASRRGPPTRVPRAAEGGEGGTAAKKKARADEYRTRKQRVHAALWVKEIEKMEEARLGGGGVGADDIDRLLDSCSDIFDSGNADFGDSKIPSTTEIKTKPDGWETTTRGQDGNIWEISQREEDILLQEFERRMAFSKQQVQKLYIVTQCYF
ncbi:hypothetical protein SEVIR_9G388800v4 [Setaria viridis]